MIAKDLRRLSKLYVKVLALHLPPPHTEYMAEAMLFISGSAGCMKQRQLVDFMEVDRRSLMPMLKELLDIGYLLATEHPECRNEYLFSLAENGKKVMPQIHEAVSAAEKIIEEKLGESRLSLFKKEMVQIEVSLKSKLLGYEFKKP
ncbi:hypothetical protein [Mucilaginibacter sp. L3T2-6]|uniref:hypothetical protein n=1 Tax=Mucilaginibacter sp. L3T2-6 TaxID=3062491 RepID=UPI0026750A55|nr:hypothetical protein [Mucilaginibacter sp. L3T2-6]MDO3643455.1 hypothetical protein [Mucilaginibacter sp. L3T2-6]MDV6215906.1 hypothetical protein [Mucilaginibacter sp. L3T2-6]